MSGFSLFDLFALAGGLALFLYGMQQGERNIRRIGSSHVRKLITIMTRHRIFAYIAGLVTTLITQSSSATTVILVGLVNAHIMTLGQSLGMILGSDLGTTFTVQLFAFKFYQIAPLLIAAGFFTSLNRKSENDRDFWSAPSGRWTDFFRHAPHGGCGDTPADHAVFRIGTAGEPDQSLVRPACGNHHHRGHPKQRSDADDRHCPGAIDAGDAAVTAVLFSVVMGANLGTCATAFLATFGAEISGVRVAWSISSSNSSASRSSCPARRCLPIARQCSPTRRRCSSPCCIRCLMSASASCFFHFSILSKS